MGNRYFEVTSAEVRDSQVFGYLIDEKNTSMAVWADSAYQLAYNIKRWRYQEEAVA